MSKQDGSAIAHGESFSDAALKIWQMISERKALNNLLAIGVNCLHPRVSLMILILLHSSLYYVPFISI